MNVLSLFSGCGGMDIGFEGGFLCHEKTINIEMCENWIEKVRNNQVVLSKTGFQTVFANDIKDETKTAWVSYFQQHNPKLNPETYRIGSIVDLVLQRTEGITETFPPNVDVVTGGFPCQDFSIAGKRLGLASCISHDSSLMASENPTIANRGQLYMWMREVVNITEPAMFIAENVKGLTNLHDVQKIIENDFKNVGGEEYIVVPPKVLHAADYGVPQNRERVFFFCFKKSALTTEAQEAFRGNPIPDEYDPYPPPTHAYTHQPTQLHKLAPFVPATAVLDDLSEPEDSLDPSQRHYSKAKYLGKHHQGQTEIKQNKIAPTIRAEHHGNIEFRRLNLNNGGTHTQELLRGLPQRRLTVRECARLQTFPDDYQFILPKTNTTPRVSGSKAYTMIGNAVPPLLAYHIAMNLRNKWSLYFTHYHNKKSDF